VAEHPSESPALAALVAQLADNKYFLGRRYAEWCTAAPALESAVAAASMAQDEIGHARSLYPVLEDLQGSSPDVVPETRQRFVNAAFLSEPFNGWTDLIAANFLFDTALSTLLNALPESTFVPLAQRARRMLEEERLHRLHAEGWTRRLAQEPQPIRFALQQSLWIVQPYAKQLLSSVDDELVRTGIVRINSSELIYAFTSETDPILRESGLSSS